MRLHELKVSDEAVAAFCRRYDISKLWLFGSVLRDDFCVDSDVDVLLELSKPIGLFKLGGVQAELSGLFEREVHVTTISAVPASERPRLLATAELKYAA